MGSDQKWVSVLISLQRIFSGNINGERTMNLARNIVSMILVSYGVVSTFPAAMADTETTTVRTTSFLNNGQQLTLPATSTYVLVDPLTGVVKGNYDPTRGFADARMVQPGLMIIDQPSGKILATVDSSGRTIDVTSVPAINSLVVAVYTRRCELERMITDALANGTIDTSQASQLRVDTDKIAAEEFAAKQYGGILPYSEALSLALTLNGVADRLTSYTHANAIAPLLGSRFASVNGQVIMVRGTEFRAAER
jgi:hypothetical protein